MLLSYLRFLCIRFRILILSIMNKETARVLLKRVLTARNSQIDHVSVYIEIYVKKYSNFSLTIYKEVAKNSFGTINLF